MPILRVGPLILAFVFLAGCAAARQPVASRTMTNQRYVLLRTADISDVPGREPYVWVEEEHVPITFICRRPDAIAPLSVLIKYLPAPRGGMISSWQSGSETLCRLRIGPD